MQTENCATASCPRSRGTQPRGQNQTPKHMKIVILIMNALSSVIFRVGSKEIATRGSRSLAVFVALSLAVVVADPPSASPSDALSRWSIVPSPNNAGANWLVAVDAL